MGFNRFPRYYKGDCCVVQRCQVIFCQDESFVVTEYPYLHKGRKNVIAPEKEFKTRASFSMQNNSPTFFKAGECHYVEFNDIQTKFEKCLFNSFFE